ncbi:MAG: anti-sigma factor, partial [Flavobacterium sp.]
MNREYIESGILELYVFGRLSDAENAEVAAMA